MGAKVTDKETAQGKKFRKMLEELSKLEVRIGFQAGDASEADGTDIATVAAWNELGTSTSPSRPFLRQSVDAHTNEISAFTKSMKSQLTNGTATAGDILKKFGVFQKGLIQGEISSGNFAPNAPSTIKKKGSSTPLIDTGTMRQSVNYVIKPKGGGD